MVDHYTFASLDQHDNNIDNDVDSNAGTTTTAAATSTTLRASGAKRAIMEPFEIDKVLMSSLPATPFTKKLRTNDDNSTLTSIGEVSICVCMDLIISTQHVCCGNPMEASWFGSWKPLSPPSSILNYSHATYNH
jgi:hypothetical protein